MFQKKCARCGRKIEKEFEFCPSCGANLGRERDEKDFGFLGKDDGFGDFFKMPIGFGMSGFGGLFNSLLKQIDKQFKEMDKQISNEKINKPAEIRKFPGSGISISISTSTGKQPEIKIKGFGPEAKELKQIREAKITNEISDEEARKLSKLPKKEAEAKVRRLSNKIVYEVELPGVKSIKDVVINKLENSIEIKAFSKDSAYFKFIPVNLPILNYKLEEGKLILELRPQ